MTLSLHSYHSHVISIFYILDTQFSRMRQQDLVILMENYGILFGDGMLSDFKADKSNTSSKSYKIFKWKNCETKDTPSMIKYLKDDLNLKDLNNFDIYDVHNANENTFPMFHVYFNNLCMVGIPDAIQCDKTKSRQIHLPLCTNSNTRIVI